MSSKILHAVIGVQGTAVFILGLYSSKEHAEQRQAQQNFDSKIPVDIVSVPVNQDGYWGVIRDGRSKGEFSGVKTLGLPKIHLLVASAVRRAAHILFIGGAYSTEYDVERRVNLLRDAYGPWPRNSPVEEWRRPRFNTVEMEVGMDTYVSLDSQSIYSVDNFWRT